MTGVNELIRMVMDNDELMKFVLTNIDQSTRKLSWDRNVKVIFNRTLNPMSSNHEQSNSHQLPLKAVTKDPHSSKRNKRFKSIKEGSKAVNKVSTITTTLLCQDVNFISNANNQFTWNTKSKRAKKKRETSLMTYVMLMDILNYNVKVWEK